MTARARRCDAVANRDRIVAEARDALAVSNGAVEELKLHLVAKAAGVGQGTLYRHFPTRGHLLAEVYRHEMDELVNAVPDLLAEHPPLDALTRWLDRLVEYARVKRGVMGAIEISAWEGLHSDQHGRLDEALDVLLEQGTRSGEVVEGVRATHVILLLGVLSRITPEDWDTQAPAVVRVILNGLRAH